MNIDKRLLQPEHKTYRPSLEKEEWERAGCSNNEEWRMYLNKQIWKDHTPDEKNGNIIGTDPVRISWKHRHPDD